MVKTDQGPMNLMRPYSECISLAGWQNGACSNCIYHKTGGNCTFSEKFFSEVAARLGDVPEQLREARAVSLSLILRTLLIADVFLQLRSGSFSELGPRNVNTDNSPPLEMIRIRDVSEWPADVLNTLKAEFPAAQPKSKKKAATSGKKVAVGSPSSTHSSDRETAVFMGGRPTRSISNMIVPYVPKKAPSPLVKSEYQSFPEEWRDSKANPDDFEGVKRGNSDQKRSVVGSRSPGLSPTLILQKPNTPVRIPSTIPENDIVLPFIEAHRSPSIPPSSPLSLPSHFLPLPSPSPVLTTSRRSSVLTASLDSPDLPPLSAKEIRDNADMDKLLARLRAFNQAKGGEGSSQGGKGQDKGKE